jgi:hypothetical protein
VDKYGITKDAIQELNRMSGSCAAACLHPDYPGDLLLLRSGSPLEAAKVGTNLFFASTKQAIYQGSRPWEEWNGFWVQEAKAPLQWLALPVQSAFIINAGKGLTYHTKFDVCEHYVKPDYSRVRTEFSTRTEFNKEALERANKPKVVETKPTIVQGSTCSTGNSYEGSWCIPCGMWQNDSRHAGRHAAMVENTNTRQDGVSYFLCRNLKCDQEIVLDDKHKDVSLWNLRCPKCKTTLVKPPKDTVVTQ